MKTILKSFRLPLDCIQFIERKAKMEQVPQAQVVVDALKKDMDLQADWQLTLQMMANEAYQKEQLEMAEEHYE